MVPRAILFTALCVAACSHRRAPDADAALTSGAPVLTRVQPDTIAIGQGAIPTLTLTGTGFVVGGGRMDTPVPGGNTVHVGPAVMNGVDGNATGTTLRFALPLTYTDTASRGRPSGFGPGRYTVTVVTPLGTSNSLSLTMIR